MGKKKSASTKAARVTLTIPPDVKRQMDQVQEEVNWSSVATQAFVQKLGEIADRKEQKTMEDVIVRLRASKESRDGEAYQKGRKAGEEWAKNVADVAELRRLERAVKQNVIWTFPESSTYTKAEMLAFVILGLTEGSEHQKEAAYFWNSVFGDESDRYTDDEAAIIGFSWAAVSLWNQVKDQI